MNGSGTNMRRLHPNGMPAARPVSWSAIPADDPAAHEQLIKFISESIVCDIQGNISSGFMKQVQASKKSAMSPHDKAERMRIVRDMRTTLERLTEELGQKFFDEFRHRPAVGRWYDSWLFNETPQFLRWEQEWAYSPDESLVTGDVRSIGGSTDGRVFGSETTPEVRVEFEEDLEDFEDTQEFAKTHQYQPDAPVTEMGLHRPPPVVIARMSMRGPTRSTFPISARRATAATRATAALRLVVVTRHARIISTTSHSTTYLALTFPGLRSSLIRVSLLTYKNITSRTLSRLTTFLSTYCRASTTCQMVTTRRSMRGGRRGRRVTTGPTRRRTYKSSNANSSISGSGSATDKGNGSSHSATTTASASEAGSRATRYGIVEPVGVVLNDKSGTAENATSVRTGGLSPVPDVGESLIHTTKNTKGWVQTTVSKAISTCQKLKKAGKKLKPQPSKEGLGSLRAGMARAEK
ncbi:hypothetical protein SAMD00023353_0501700 [Rosellinia necatrix]|uniref:Uncharacterized protein n=1 Tax=Rosellinia necatrix TaxID=77044 RepID=A0A1S8A5J4_ROSNE|nr:hypothetical protein SAMD00023353_0501700 [Rosellinia necatrix]